jgi:hypothetical protein
MFQHPTTRRRSAPRAVAAAVRLIGVLTCAFALVAAPLAPPAAAQQQAPRQRAPYGNVVNQRFHTVSSGPQSAVIVDIEAGAPREQVAAAIRRRVQADFRSRARSLAGPVRRLRAAGALKPNTALPISTIVMEREDGKLVMPSWKSPGATRAVGGGTLTFDFQGFSNADRDFLQQFVALAYPRIVALYGQPAVSGTVKVINYGPLDGGQGTDVQRLAFGAYNASTNEIYLPLYESLDSFALAFLLNMVHAFHGPAVFQYDAWEQGFARAAASIIARQPEFGFADASGNFLYSLLQFYDLLNQPGLGNPTFFPPSQANIDIDDNERGSLGKMIFPRLGMSGAAWLKVYIENPQFFRQFNEAYYQQFNPTPQGTPNFGGNVPALKTIAASLLPNGVEGQPFEEWYRRQYVLDTSVSPGRKLYATLIPGEVTADNRQSHLIQLVYFRSLTRSESPTGVEGDEQLLTGRAYATYFDSTNARLNLGVASEQAEIVEGEGSFTATTNQRQGVDGTRITMNFSVGNDTAQCYVPAGFGGDFQAVVLGPNATGQMRVQMTTVSPIRTLGGAANLEGAAAGVNLGIAQNDLGVLVVDVDNAGVVQRYRINGGDGRYYAVLRPNASAGGVTTVSHVFRAGSMPNLIAFPVRPLSTIADQALGLPSSEFLLSTWDPVRGRYVSAAPDAGESALGAIQPGRGYWFKLQPLSGATEVNVSVTGTAVPTDTDFTISAPFGWSLIGSPFQQPFNINQVLVKYLQNDAITWEEAVESNLVAALPYSLEAGGYQESDTLDGSQWKGYWVRVLIPGGVTLLLPGPDSETTRAVAARRSRSTIKPAARPDWSVRLTARQSGDDLPFGGVATARFGTASGATRGFDNRYDRELPPPVVNSQVSITFPHSDFGNASSTRYVADFRESNRRGTWDVTVTAAKEGPVTLAWDNLGTVPRNQNLYLVDKATGERISLRSRSAFTYQAGAESLTRQFQIIAEPARSTALTLTNVQITRVPGRAADGSRRMAISYNVSGNADVQVELSSLSGKSLRQLGGGRATANGRQTVLWDGRSQDGGALPAGPYQVRIIARGENGEQATVVRPVTLLN